MIPAPVPFEFWKISDAIMARMRGKKFCHMGRNPEQGFDCLGTNLYYFPELGLPIDAPKDFVYPKDFWKQGVDFQYLEAITEQFATIQEEVVSKGDLVMFKPEVLAPNVGHTGIVYDGKKHLFLHAFLKRGVTLSCWDDRFWRTRLFAFGRHKKTELLLHRRQDIPVGMKT